MLSDSTLSYSSTRTATFPKADKPINQIGEHVVGILCLVQWSDAIGYGGLEQSLFQPKCQSVYLLFQQFVKSMWMTGYFFQS